MLREQKCFIILVLLMIAFIITVWVSDTKDTTRFRDTKHTMLMSDKKDKDDLDDSLISQNKSGYKRIHVFNFSPKLLDRHPLGGCKSKCYTTIHEKNFEDSDFVLFLAPFVNTTPPKKRRGQIWIFMSYESPHSHPSLKQWKNLVNWTMTYRRDSDFPIPYGGFRQLTQKEKLNVNKDNVNKNTSIVKIAWAVSNYVTPNLRFQFVSLMSRDERITVDIYGPGERHKCPRFESKCFKLFSQQYTHYLAFENSNCMDYLTEKPFKVYANMNFTVPIVRGYTSQYSLFLPPGSYINSDDFKSVDLLNEYIIRTTTDRDEFKKFFNWKQFFTFDRDAGGSICELCERLHTKDYDVKYRRLYDDIDLWYQGDNINPTCTDNKGMLYYRKMHLCIIICSNVGILGIMIIVLCQLLKQN